MSGKLRLGKTADSRTRRKLNVVEDANKAVLLQQVLSEQKDFANYLLLKGFSTTTTNRYIRDAENFIEWIKKENVETETVSYADVLHYIQHKRSTVKQRTISIHVNSIKHFYNYLNTTGQVADNPTTQIEVKGIKSLVMPRG